MFEKKKEIPTELEYFLLYSSEPASFSEDNHFGPADLFMTVVVLLPVLGKAWEWYSKS